MQLFCRADFDHFPELGILLQRLVLAGGQAGTEQEILERVAAEDAVDDDAQFMALKIDPVIAQAKAVQRLAVALHLAEMLQIAGEDFLGNPRNSPRI